MAIIVLSEKAKKKLRKYASGFVFGLAIEYFHNDIIREFRGFLAPIKPDEMRDMISLKRFPKLDGVDFGAVSNNIEYLERIKPLELMETIAEARPDLAAVLQDMNVMGAEYIFALREYLLQRIRASEMMPCEGSNMKMAKCSECGKEIPVDPDNPPEECPFCHK